MAKLKAVDMSQGESMQDNNTQIWRSMLQLAQATYAVLEREIPESEGLPTNGLAVMRLLRWHGAKTLGTIAAFVGVTTVMMDEILREMIRLGFIRHESVSSNGDTVAFELAPLGIEATRRIILAQRDRIARSVARLDEGQQEVAATMLEKLAYGLVTDSAGFGITCAECWAFDARECISVNSSEHCAFRKAQRANLDFDLSEGAGDCPCSFSEAMPHFIELGVDSADPRGGSQ